MTESEEIILELTEEMRIDEMWDKTFHNQGVLIVQNCPVGLEFGIDTNSYELGPNFQGMVMIPEGLHLLYFGSINSPRDGIFFNISPAERFILKIWDQENNTLVDGFKQLSEEAVLNLKKVIISGQLNAQLAPYQQDQHHIWRNLSLFITPQLLDRFNIPINETFTITENIDFTPEEQKKLGKLSFQKDQNPLQLPTPKLTSLQSLEQQYIEKNFYTLSLEPNKINQMKLDKTWLLDYLIQNIYPNLPSSSSSSSIPPGIPSSSWILGEYQLSFILFLFLISFSSLNSWKYLLHCIIHSENYLKNHKKFLKSFLLIFFYQLKFLSYDFLENEISKENFLLPIFTSLFTLLHSMTSSLLITPRMKMIRESDDENASPMVFDEPAEEETLHGPPTEPPPIPPGGQEESKIEGMQKNITTTILSITEQKELEDILELQLRINKFLDKKYSITFYQQNLEIPMEIPTNAPPPPIPSIPPPPDYSPISFQSKIEERLIAQSSLMEDEEDVPVITMNNITSAFQELLAEADELLEEADRIQAKKNMIPKKDIENRNHEDDNDDDAGDIMDTAAPESSTKPPTQEEQPPIDLSTISITPENKHLLKFSWRYPLLFQANEETMGREDLLMTAMRILDESEELSQNIKDDEERLKQPLLLLRNESITFIFNETQFLT